MSLKDLTPGPHEVEYWYNLRTGEVEEGQQSKISDLWGPFPTHEEAAAAMTKAKERNEAWEAESDTW